MAKNTNEILSLIKRVSGQETSLNMLMEFERTLDATNLYAYKNWMNGELVEGPIIDRYWFTTTWMYPFKMMPDPAGSLRLLQYGCKVYYKKDILKEPSRVLGREDLRQGIEDEQKKAKILRKSVWLITIEMPLEANHTLNTQTEGIDQLAGRRELVCQCQTKQLAARRGNWLQLVCQFFKA